MCRAIVENLLSGTKAGFKATRNLVFNQKAERSTMNRQKSRGLVENVLSGMKAGFKSILNIFKHQKRESRMFNQKINQKSSSTLSTTLLALILGASVFMAGQVWAAKMVKDPSTGKMVTAPEYGGTLNLVWGPESQGPDPSITGHHAGFLVSGVYERLAQADWGVDRDVFDIKAGGVVPVSFFIGQLAESWSQPDATTIIFNIRKGVYWHDKAPMNGRELTAKDIEYNWHRLAALGSGFTELPALFGSIPNVPFKSITATDDWTVVFKLKQPMLSALKIILDDAWTWILPPEVIKEHGDVADWRNVVGTGPYMLTEWIDGSSMTWKKNPDYWGYDEKYPENRLPYIDELKGLFILDEATRLSALRTGKVGFGGMGTHWSINSLDDFESLQKTTDLELWPFYQRSNYAFSLNVTEPPFSDIRVRRAMQMALDLETISETFFKGFASWQPQGLIAEHQIGWSTPFETWPEEIKQYYRYDPEGAEALLDEAGYRRGADGIRFKTILSHSFPKFSDYGEISIAYWDAIGVDVELVITDGPTWNTQVKDQSYGGLTYGSAAMPYDPVKSMIRYYKDSPWNPSGASDPAYDALYEPALAATTVEEAQMLVKEMDTMAIKELWTLWGPMAPAFFASQPWLKGYNGEVVLGDMNSGPAMWARLWIDQELKEAMGH